MVVVNCATGTLSPYTDSSTLPWNTRRATHLFRRIGFSATELERESAISQNPQSLIDDLISAASNAPLSPAPQWGFWSYNDYMANGLDYSAERDSSLDEMGLLWFKDLMDNPVRGKLSIFWHNHFVAEQETYDCPSYLFQYYRKIQENIFGNFKEFTRAIGLEPAMLVYLNGADNTKLNPNENYGRELFELFTLGVDNGYTQQDIEETARALTGYNNFSDYCGTVSFNEDNFDDGIKTIFGQTGNWNYDDVINILFDQRANEIANFICGKLYKFYVHPEINETIVEGLANTLIANNFDLLPVYQQLWKSEHFFDEKVMNVIVKSPIDTILSTSKEVGFDLSTDERKLAMWWYSSYMGQYIGNPINVAGWPGNRAWISTEMLTIRWGLLSWFAWEVHEVTPQRMYDLAIHLVGGDDLTSSAELVVQNVIDYFIPGGLRDPVHYERATLVFKADIPSNYYDNGQWNLQWDTIHWQMALLIDHIGKMPEMQLM